MNYFTDVTQQQCTLTATAWANSPQN